MGETKTGWLLGNVTSADLNFLQHRCPVLFPETYIFPGATLSRTWSQANQQNNRRLLCGHWNHEKRLGGWEE